MRPAAVGTLAARGAERYVSPHMTTAVSPRSTRAPLVWRASKLALGLGALAALAYGGFVLHRFEQRPLTLEGVRVGGGDPEPLVRELADDWYETEVTIDAGSQIVRATRRELGGHLDVERTVRELRAARGGAPIWARVWAISVAREDEHRWHRDVREPEARAFAEALRTRAFAAATPPRRDGSGGRPGLALNLVGSTAAIVSALTTDAVFVRLPTNQLAPPVRPVHDPRVVSYTEVVASFETRYGGERGRVLNIERAAHYLDGTVVRAGEVISFNAVVGERSTVRGFHPAIELGGGGRRVEGTGGGVCQVAATLFAAAFFGAFDVVEQHPHTRNSSYIEPGLDAAVSWPNHDLRVRNPHPFPIRVSARASRGVLRVSLMGPEAAPPVEWSSEIIQRIPRGVEREVVRSLPLGSVEIVDEGEDGVLVERTRTVHWHDGDVSETTRLNYPVVNQLLRVGPTSVGQ
jgi:vancomycin resistance protein YoaR